MFKRAQLFLAAAMAVASFGAVAQSASYLDDIARLDAQIALQRKQIEARDLAVQAAGRLTLPTVRYLSGFEDDLSAVLSYGGGKKMTVKRGDRLPGGIEVLGIREKGVLVSIGKQQALLEFSAPDDGTPALSAGQGQAAAGGLMPPLPVVNVPLPASIGRTAVVAVQAVPAVQTPAPAASAQVQAKQAKAASPAAATQAMAAVAPAVTPATAPAVKLIAAPAAAPVATTALAIGRPTPKSN